MSNCPCDQRVFPPALVIPAGLVSLPRQLATFPEFRAAMLAAIPAAAPLRDWRAREGDDLGLMLLEMWAYICDALSFYTEVIAHEAYLGTARLQPSLRRLVALLGYLPTPAVAASVKLAAFADGRQAVTLPSAAAFRSGAFNGNAPQVFELDADTEIHPFFNEWKLVPVRPAQTTLIGSYVLVEAGTAAVKKDDVILLVTPAGKRVLTVSKVGPYTGQDREAYTKIEFTAAVALSGLVTVSQVRLLKPASTAALWQRDSGSTMYAVVQYVAEQAQQSQRGSFARQQAAGKQDRTAAHSTLVLDSLYRNVRAGDYVFLSQGGEYRWFQVTKVEEVSQEVSPATTIEMTSDSTTTTVSVPAVTTYVTQLTLDASVNDSGRSNVSSPESWSLASPEDFTVHFVTAGAGAFTVEARTTLARTDTLVATGKLALPDSPSAPSTFLLEDANQQGLEVTGTLNFATGRLSLDQTVEWDEPLTTPVKLYGNLISATRGESVSAETLGTGDASQANQSFQLKKSPLTYLSAPSSSQQAGASSTLEVYVGGVLWSEAASFYGATAESQIYIVRQDDDANTIITFGDGVRGSRLPSGAAVVACYRHGAGADSPPAGSIMQLAKAVTGLKSVRNPVAASGGQDAEDSSKLQVYAPRSALLLGRAISIPDFEAAAAAQGPRAVAAHWRWNQQRQRAVVQIYYIGDAGLDAKITAALRGISDPATPIAVNQATAVPRELSLDIETDSRYLEDDVLDHVREALLDSETGLLAPERIGIGQPLMRSRIFDAVLAVKGALAVRSILLDGSPLLGFAVTPGAGCYFDFETGGLILNGKA